MDLRNLLRMIGDVVKVCEKALTDFEELGHSW